MTDRAVVAHNVLAPIVLSPNVLAPNVLAPVLALVAEDVDQHVHVRDRARRLLKVVEVVRHSDHCVGDLLGEVLLRGLLEVDLLLASVVEE
eukprot:16440102-Heterocapsa_arctica.AAC.1